MLKETSCYSSNLLIDYSISKGIPEKLLFKDIEQYSEILKNPLEWINFDVWNTLACNFEMAYGNKPNILFEVGKEIQINQISNFQLLFFKIAPLKLIIPNVGQHIEKNINKNLIAESILYPNCKLSFSITPKNKNNCSTQLCDFNRGCAYAVLLLKGYKNIKVEEISCAARGDSPSCIYNFSWDPAPSTIEKIRDIFYFRFSSQKAILSHIEESHEKLQSQYKELEATKDFYSHIMTNLNESVLWLERNGIITFANQGFLSLTNLKQEEVHGRCFADFLLKESTILEYKKLSEQCLKSPLVPITSEFIIHTGEGKERIGQTSITWVSSQHRDPGFLLCIRDITASKKIQQQLFMAENRYKALYENSPAIIIGLNSSGTFIYVNPAMEEQSGYTEEELKTMHFGQLVAPNAEFDADRILVNMLSGQTHLQEVHFKSKDDQWKCVTLNTYPLYDSQNGIAGFAGIGVDVTETKRLNEQIIKAQRMELLGQLAGGLAHDFNNLLSAISGYSLFIQMQSTEEKIKKYGETIGKAGIRAADLVKNLLAFSRGDVGKTERFDVNEIVREVGKIMVGVATSSIEIKTELPNEPQYVMGNPGKIHQCIMNLCVNAKDAIGKKSGSIIIRVVFAENKDGYLWIQVEDTGTGIPPVIIEKIFDPFFTTKKKKEGTGLGLSVVYGIIKSHKGDIFVDSRPGEGTTFTMELPRFKEEFEQTIKKSILVLDSDDLIRNYCIEILKGSGHNVIDFSSVTDAKRWMQEHKNEIQLVLSDVTVQDTKIEDFLTFVKTINNDLECIWMSGNVINTQTNKMIKDIPFLQKPFTPTALLQTIQSLKTSN